MDCAVLENGKCVSIWPDYDSADRCCDYHKWLSPFQNWCVYPLNSEFMIGKNNPFNIRFVRSNHWIGQTGQTNGFVDFSDISYGIRAAALLVMRTYRSNGILTISEIINRYAPPTENNVNRYIQFICERLGVFPFDIPKDIDDYYKLLTAMSCFEGNRIEYWKLKEVCEYFGIKPIKPCKK